MAFFARAVMVLMGIALGAAHLVLKDSKKKGARLPPDLRDALVSSEVVLALAIALPIFAIFSR